MMLGISEDRGKSVEAESSGRDHVATLTKNLPFDVAEVNEIVIFVHFRNIFSSFV